MRVALVFDRPYVDAHPCFREMAVQFAKHGWGVDLVVETCDTHPLPDFGGLNVRVMPFLKNYRGLAQVLKRLMVPNRYDLVVATPQWPLYWAVRMRGIGRYAVVCLSDEIFVLAEANTDSKKKWKQREADAHRKADLTVSLSEERMRMAAAENGLNGQPYVIIPNAGSGYAFRETSTYYRDRFSVPAENTLLVHSGTLDWRLPAQLAKSAANWEHPLDIVFQGRFTGANRQPVEGPRVHFEDRVFPAADMHRVTSSADIGVALYDRTHPLECRNGETPGKLGLYLSCALPVICGNVDSLRWIADEGCGVWVEDLDAIPAAASRIRSDYAEYSRNAARVFDERFEYSSRFEEFLAKLEAFVPAMRQRGVTAIHG